MMERVNALLVFSKLFFGEHILLVQNLQVLSQQYHKKKILLKTANNLNDQFIVIFLYSIYYLPRNIKKISRHDKFDDDEDIVSPPKRNKTNSNNNYISGSTSATRIINNFMVNELKLKSSEN